VMLSDLHPGDTVSLTFTGTGADRMISRGDVTRGSRTASSSYSGSSTTTSPSSSSSYGSSTTSRNENLPATASPLPALLTTGLILLAGGFALRRQRRV